MDIKGFEGKYEIYEDGSIWTVGNKFNGYKRKKMATKVNRSGYLQLFLSKDGWQKTYTVHRLVAETFISNPNNLPQVNHIDGNKQNNAVSNLEWVTAKQNKTHAMNCKNSTTRAAVLKTISEYNDKIMYKKVVLEKDGIKYSFNSTREAAKFSGSTRDYIIRAFNRGHKTQGYKVLVLTRTANGEALIGNAKGNTVGNLKNIQEPVSTIPRKGSKGDFVTL